LYRQVSTNIPLSPLSCSAGTCCWRRWGGLHYVTGTWLAALRFHRAAAIPLQTLPTLPPCRVIWPECHRRSK
jgi:hypothetical protein